MSTATVARLRSRHGLVRRLLGGMALAFGVATLLSGAAHETRTLIAMTLRSGAWVAQALVLLRLLDGDLHA